MSEPRSVREAADRAAREELEKKQATWERQQTAQDTRTGGAR